MLLICIEDDPSEHDSSSDEEMLKRHQSGLQKELQKKEPNPGVVNLYLNKEYTKRREWLQMLPAEGRVTQLLSYYPCFKDHVEVI